MFVVFLLCGFWHGASWTFVAWGVLHGTTLVVERMGLLKLLERLPRPVSGLYALLFVMAGWILFRSDSFAAAAAYFGAIFRLRDWGAFSSVTFDGVINTEGWVALLVGVSGAMGLQARVPIRLVRRSAADSPWAVSPAGLLAMVSLFIASAMKLASSSFNPFIYYRF
jgi:alginate O-acetyltransferase complex protein AlgI